MTRRTEPVTRLQPDWWSKTGAILLCCYPLALALAGLLELALPAGDSRNQLIMWTVAALTLLLVAFSFLFKNGLRAWAYLAGANLCYWTLLKLLQPVSGGF